jgi:sugar phosphate isomerase/epimerase
MQLNVFRTLWGVTTPWQQTVSELKSVGCCGIEARVPLTVKSSGRWPNACRRRAGVYRHCLQRRRRAFRPGRNARAAGAPKRRFAAAKRLTRASSICWPATTAGRWRSRWIFSAEAHELAAEYELTCSFETHRATSLYSPWLTLEIIQQLPQLRFTADISHWIVVSERLLDDPCDDFSAFIDRVHHIQARVGYDQGPQVPHPARRNISRRCSFNSASGNRSGNRSAGAATSTPR